MASGRDSTRSKVLNKQTYLGRDSLRKQWVMVRWMEDDSRLDVSLLFSVSLFFCDHNLAMKEIKSTINIRLSVDHVYGKKQVYLHVGVSFDTGPWLDVLVQ